jgi:hypothetical protein
MKPIHLPALGPRYWTALCIASVLGRGMMDRGVGPIGSNVRSLAQHERRKVLEFSLRQKSNSRNGLNTIGTFKGLVRK